MRRHTNKKTALCRAEVLPVVESGNCGAFSLNKDVTVDVLSIINEPHTDCS